MANATRNKNKISSAGVERTVFLLLLGIFAVGTFFLLVAGLGTLEQNGLQPKYSRPQQRVDDGDVVPLENASVLSGDNDQSDE